MKKFLIFNLFILSFHSYGTTGSSNLDSVKAALQAKGQNVTYDPCVGGAPVYVSIGSAQFATKTGCAQNYATATATLANTGDTITPSSQPPRALGSATAVSATFNANTGVTTYNNSGAVQAYTSQQGMQSN